MNSYVKYLLGSKGPQNKELQKNLVSLQSVNQNCIKNYGSVYVVYSTSVQSYTHISR